ncbi:tetratricopeptide repeat protein [Bacillus cereus]|uniref:tetratricopeptide repeat protein n=1 Tax=Bacillus cereus TaxID=1396 RepID=UPI003D02AC5A
MELQDELYDRIVSICSQGDNLVDRFEYENALEKYLEALDLVPKPKFNWECSTWIYTALGDTCYMNGDFSASKDFLFNAINCPDGIGNPFIMLRLGECLYELGDLNKSKEYLLRAYILEGYSIFDSEDDKYFNVIKDAI